MIFYLLIILGFISLNNNTDELNNYLKTKLNRYSKVVWEVSTLPAGITSFEDNRLKIDDDGNLKIKGEFLYLPVKIKRNDNRYSKSVVTLKVKLFTKVYSAIKTIQKGEVIDISDLMLLESDITSLRSEPVTDISEEKTYRAKFIIKNGMIIEENIVEELPLILIGNTVKAIKQNGSVVISFDVKAKDDGKLGGIIRVQREDGKIFKAKIENKEIVKIIE
ncbi:MAG TPA: flagellar basal body P-ring formation chaperone FlgA [Melioribacteraceae bacterium]|nr:flagellar basal body P-ring formation chaperone FlgA [Melioribacteraceae bacterium]